MTQPYKPIKFRPDKWQIIKDFANELADERGTFVSLPNAVLESVQVNRDKRKAKPKGAK